MAKQTATFETTCPNCGETVRVVAARDQVADGQARVPAACERCLSHFEATTDLDCLEWDEACTSEIGRLA